MTVQNVKAFFEKVEGDKALQEKLRKLVVEYKGQNEKGVMQLVKLAEDEGFPFTKVDFTNAEAEARAYSNNEIIWLKRRFETKSQCGYPPCGSGGAAFTCPSSNW